MNRGALSLLKNLHSTCHSLIPPLFHFFYFSPLILSKPLSSPSTLLSPLNSFHTLTGVHDYHHGNLMAHSETYCTRDACHSVRAELMFPCVSLCGQVGASKWRSLLGVTVKATSLTGPPQGRVLCTQTQEQARMN